MAIFLSPFRTHIRGGWVAGGRIVDRNRNRYCFCAGSDALRVVFSQGKCQRYALGLSAPFFGYPVMRVTCPILRNTPKSPLLFVHMGRSNHINREKHVRIYANPKMPPSLRNRKDLVFVYPARTPPAFGCDPVVISKQAP